MGGIQQRSELPVLSRITLSIDPAVPPDDVAECYKRLQNIALGHDVRRLKDKHLTLAAFLYTRPKQETNRQAMKRWNQQYPDGGYEQLSNFTKDGKPPLTGSC